MKKVQLNELKVDQYIWFKSPYNNTLTYWGEVKELYFNFNGGSYVIVQVGTELYKIDERYTFCVEED